MELSSNNNVEPVNGEGLDALEVVLVDIQTTGASPDKGHALEMAWARFRACDPGAPRVESSVIELPGGARIPKHISRMTGIRASDLKGARPVGQVWAGFEAALVGLPQVSDQGQPLVVAHYAQFERRFLEDLCGRAGGTQAPPLFCSHGLARKLLPDLPRCGIKAVAGYFGHPVTRLKRAPHHVLATAAVWKGLVELLMVQGVETHPALVQWMAQTAGRKRVKGSKGTFALPRERRLGLPDAPGVYRMVGRTGQVLYVGKAMSLKRRVNSYFQKRRGHQERTLEMLTCVHDLKVTETGSALEAAVLESDEIKRHSPPYNIALQDEGRRVGFATQPGLEPLVGCVPGRGPLLGPLRSVDTLEPLRLLVEVLKGGPLPKDEQRALMLGAQPEKLPDDECLQAGLEELVKRHNLSPEDSLTQIWSVGEKLWEARQEARQKARERKKARKEAADNTEEEPLTPEKAQDKPEWQWSPGLVSVVLGSVIMIGALRVRRGQWLSRLAHSTLVWTPRHRPLLGRRVLNLRAGRVESAHWLPHDAPLPKLDTDMTLEERQRVFDATVYDRMRVLLAELRRVIEENGEVWLISTNTTLNTQELWAITRLI